MIRIAIVEDEESYIKVLKGYLARYAKEENVSFKIDTFFDGIDIVSDYSADFDIVLLDIQMKFMNGMDAAAKIRALDENVELIFITNTAHFAVQGYTVNALGYILKPVPYSGFAQILRKAITQVSHKQDKYYLSIGTEGAMLKLEIGQIYYIESMRHNVIIHSDKGEYTTPGPMKKMEALLGPKGFSKCHNAYLVNLAHASGVHQNDVSISNGDLVPISRARKKPFMEDLTNYIGGYGK